MKRPILLLPLLALALPALARSVVDPYHRNDGERLPTPEDVRAAKQVAIPAPEEVSAFRFWEGSWYLRDSPRFEGVYRHPVSRKDGERLLSLLSDQTDWSVFGIENYSMFVREVDLILTNGVIQTLRLWGDSGLVVLSSSNHLPADFHIPKATFAAVTELTAKWRKESSSAEIEWYRKRPLPTVYRVQDGPDRGILSGVSTLFYGDGNKWRVIWEANKAVLPDPNILRPGLTLTIPAIAPALATPSSEEETHAESAEDAESEPHAEGAE